MNSERANAKIPQRGLGSRFKLSEIDLSVAHPPSAEHENADRTGSEPRPWASQRKNQSGRKKREKLRRSQSGPVESRVRATGLDILNERRSASLLLSLVARRTQPANRSGSVQCVRGASMARCCSRDCSGGVPSGCGCSLDRARLLD